MGYRVEMGSFERRQRLRAFFPFPECRLMDCGLDQGYNLCDAISSFGNLCPQRLGDLQDLLRGSSRSSIIGLDHARHPVVETIQLSAVDLSTHRWLFVSLGS